ncbi:MAG: SLBB domain-containing protein, partial [Gammaproteobacteria bacterium]|nr:SLBB domain-containing protein [Gammaproteobacteria bacterium]
TERLIEGKLAENFLQDPRVTIFVKEYESQKITIEGFVGSPGVKSLTGKTTVLQAIAMAGGAVRLADQKKVVIFRTVAENQVVGYKIDIHMIRSGEIKDPFVQNKDIIVVPKHGGRGAVDEWQRLTSGIPLL